MLDGVAIRSTINGGYTRMPLCWWSSTNTVVSASNIVIDVNGITGIPKKPWPSLVLVHPGILIVLFVPKFDNILLIGGN